MKKVVVITNIPNPYRLPLFNCLNEKLLAAGYTLKVLFASATYSRRKFTLKESDFRFDYQVLNSKEINPGNDPEKTTFSYKGLSHILRSEKPDIVIVNGFSIASMIVWLLSFFMNYTIILWTGSVEKAGRNDGPLRILQRKILLKRASKILTYGSRSAQYIRKLGTGQHKLITAINTVDTTFFKEQTEKYRKVLPPDKIKHLTFLGYLVPRKNTKAVLEIIKELSQQRTDFVLDILGDGSDKALLEKFVAENKLAGFVNFHGFIQKEQIPEFLAKSSCFLFQTDFDIWGLVLNEAMAAGIPVLASVNAGATDDLIIEGKTGYAVNFNDTGKIVVLINQLLDNPGLISEIGKAASGYIGEIASINKSAEGFMHAITSK